MKKKGWKERLRNLHKEINGDELFGSCASHNEGLDCCTEKKWLLDFIEQELDKAERRGFEKAIKKIIAEYGENYNNGCGCCSTKYLEDELPKLLEEENGLK